MVAPGVPTEPRPIEVGQTQCEEVRPEPTHGELGRVGGHHAGQGAQDVGAAHLVQLHHRRPYPRLALAPGPEQLHREDDEGRESHPGQEAGGGGHLVRHVGVLQALVITEEAPLEGLVGPGQDIDVSQREAEQEEAEYFQGTFW